MDAPEGYSVFVAVAEFWKMKTPFTQWFTKNYASMFMPMCNEMGLSIDGHATWLIQVAAVLSTVLRVVNARIVNNICHDS